MTDSNVPGHPIERVPPNDAVLARLTVMAQADKLRAAKLQITNDEEYEVAAVVLRDIRRSHQEGLTEYEAIYTPLWQAVQALRERRREVVDPWEAAEKRLRQTMTTYHTDRQEAIEDERLTTAEAFMEGIDEVEDPDELVERAAAARYELEKIPESAPAAEGISYRDNWTVKVLDPRALALAVGNDELPEDYVTPNKGALDKLAKALKGHFKVPGCIAQNKRVMQVRTKG